MKITTLLILLLFYVSGFTQDTLDLFSCYSIAEKNYPINKQKKLYQSSSKLNNKNISSIYYPQINLSGKATYQSDVTQVDIVMPEMPGIGQIPSPETQKMSKDQYRISLDVNQIFFDGGLNKTLKDIDNADLNVNIQKVNVELYKLKKRINSLYFGILIFQETYKQLDITIKNLDEQKKIIESGIKNGILLESAQDVISAEILKLEQNQLEIEINKQKLLKSLSDYLCEEINPNAIISIPKLELIPNASIRPENILFELNKTKLDASAKLLTKKRFPVVYGFGQFGYGRPGLNMLNNDFDSFYIVGAKLNWNIWDWKRTKRIQQNIEITKQIIDTQKETFDKNINIALQNTESDIDKLEQLIQKDEEIIILREKITKKTASQLKNGIINSTNYITELNSETIARINLAIHKIQLIQTKINYQTIKGF
jgi:outer membrane protein TolC